MLPLHQPLQQSSRNKMTYQARPTQLMEEFHIQDHELHIGLFKHIQVVCKDRNSAVRILAGRLLKLNLVD